MRRLGAGTDTWQVHRSVTVSTGGIEYAGGEIGSGPGGVDKEERFSHKTGL
jgi:hypothetical protein